MCLFLMSLEVRGRELLAKFQIFDKHGRALKVAGKKLSRAELGRTWKLQMMGPFWNAT